MLPIDGSLSRTHIGQGKERQCESRFVHRGYWRDCWFASPWPRAPAPPLPAEIVSQGVLRVGVKCDYPPSGFLDADRNFAGIEVDMARYLATKAFGSPDKAALQCVTAKSPIRR